GQWYDFGPRKAADNTPVDSNNITAIGTAPSNNRWYYVGWGDGEIYHTEDDAGYPPPVPPNPPPPPDTGLDTHWTRSLGAKAWGNPPVRALAVDQDPPATVYAGFGGLTAGKHVFMSTNAGTAWTDITGNLPSQVPVNVLAIDKQGGVATLYAGTDFGVYQG